MPVVPPDTEKMGGSAGRWPRAEFPWLSGRFSADVDFFGGLVLCWRVVGGLSRSVSLIPAQCLPQGVFSDQVRHWLRFGILRSIPTY